MVDSFGPYPYDDFRDARGSSGLPSAGCVFGLMADLGMASKIAKAAKLHHLAVQNFDRAEVLVSQAQHKKPCLILIDWDQLESEGFKVLKELAQNADLNRVASVGFVSQSKADLKEEAERAGCHRVYKKTEFNRALNELMMRYAP